MNNPVPLLKADRNGVFRILQLTDLHTDVDEAANARTWADIRSMIDRFTPDLLAVTGDVWCGDDHPDEAPEWMARDLAYLSDLGVPWAFTWGNHDFGVDTPEAQVRIAAAPHSLTPAHATNYRLEVVRGNEAEPLVDLYFLNSHTECLLPDDLAWLESESRRLQSLRGMTVPGALYFHIPLKQYELARIEGRFRGIGPEEVGYWGNKEHYIEPIRRTGAIRVCFVGHSHRNDFSFAEDGITFSYGRATGHGGYGGDELAKGATLLEIRPGNPFSFRTVFPDGSSWSHDDGAVYP